MNILEFTNILNKQIIVTYYPNQDCRFSAHLKGCEVEKGGCLASISGESDNPAGAINRYFSLIQGETLVFDAMGDNRQEFTAPDSFEMLGK